MWLETVEDVDAYVAEAGWSMSRFIQSLVNRSYVDVTSKCWCWSEQHCRSWTRELLHDLVNRGYVDMVSRCWSAAWWCSYILFGNAGVCCLVVQVSAAWWSLFLLLGDAVIYCLVMQEFAAWWCRCLLLGDADTSAAVEAGIGAAGWSWSWSTCVCCLVMQELVQHFRTAGRTNQFRKTVRVLTIEIHP